MQAFNPTATKKLTDCYWFFQNPPACNKGETCEYRHCEAARGNTVPCKFWQGGYCNNPNCPYRHATPPPQLAIMQQLQLLQQMALPMKSPQPCSFFARGMCNKGDACPFTHQGPASFPTEDSYAFQSRAQDHNSFEQPEYSRRSSNSHENNGGSSHSEYSRENNNKYKSNKNKQRDYEEEEYEDYYSPEEKRKSNKKNEEKKYEKKPIEKKIEKKPVEKKIEKKPVEKNSRKPEKQISQAKNKNTNSTWNDPRESKRAERFSDSNKSTKSSSSSSVQKEKDRLDHKKTGTLNTVKKAVDFGVKPITEILVTDKKESNPSSNNKSTPSGSTERKKGLTLPKEPSKATFGVKTFEELLQEKNQPTPAPQEPKAVVTQTITRTTELKKRPNENAELPPDKKQKVEQTVTVITPAKLAQSNVGMSAPLNVAMPAPTNVAMPAPTNVSIPAPSQVVSQTITVTREVVPDISISNDIEEELLGIGDELDDQGELNADEIEAIERELDLLP